jgi:uncharacterized membrane protein YfcA
VVVGLLLSVLIGVSLGLLGGGGSILTVPILIYAMGMEPKSAIATSLFVVGVTSLVGSISHARAGRVRYRTGLIFGFAGMIGAFAGGKLAHYIPANLLLLAFAGMMIATAIAMLRGRKEIKAPTVGELPVLKVVVEGIVVGIVTGLVGAGGGFLVVPALALLGGLPMNIAIGTSLLVIAMKSFAGLAGYLGHVAVDWTLALSVTGAAVLGSFAGAMLAGKIAQETLRKGFGWFVVVMAIYLLNKQLPASVVETELYQTVVLRAWPVWAAIVAATIGLLVLKQRRTAATTEVKG